jgi:hypothetical protein
MGTMTTGSIDAPPSEPTRRDFGMNPMQIENSGDLANQVASGLLERNKDARPRLPSGLSLAPRQVASR